MSEHSPTYSKPDLHQLRQIAEVAHFADDVIDATSTQAFTASMVEFLRAHPEQQEGQGRYTEVHVVDEEPVVVVSPRPMRPYGATVGGHHSIVDELKMWDGNQYPRFMGALEGLHPDISTDTIVAKGLLKAHADGNEELELKEIRGSERTLPWLQKIHKIAPEMGIDGGVSVTENHYMPDAKNTKLDQLRTAFSVRSDIEIYHATSEFDPENPAITTGIIKGIVQEDEQMALGYGSNDLQKTSAITLNILEGHTILHSPLYEASDLDGGDNRYLKVLVEGEEVGFNLQYASDERDNTQSINIFYEKDYGDTVADFQKSLVSHVRHEVLPYMRDGNYRLTVARGNNPSELVS
jgi:hypothetical protein